MALIFIQIISDLSLYFAITFYLLALFQLSSPVYWLVLSLPLCLYGFNLYKRHSCNKSSHPIAYSNQKDHFLKGLRLLPLFALPAIATFNVEALEQKALPWIIIYLFSNVLLLNILRHSPHSRQNHSFAAIFLGGILLCCLLFLESSRVILMNFFNQGLWMFYQYIIRPLLISFGYLLSLIIWLFVELIKGLADKNPKNNTTVDWSAAPTLNELISTDSGFFWPTWLSYIKPLFLFAVLCWLTFLLCRRNLKPSQNNQLTHSTSQHREALPSSPPSTGLFRQILAPKDPRLAIRFYYRKFLLLCSKRGLSITQSNTSAEIQDKAQPLFPAKALAEIRQYYIRARYDTTTINSEDVTYIKKLYKDIKTWTEDKPKP